MQVINNNSKYLTSEIIESCFEYNKHNFVDKVVTGNGFSTGFLNLHVPMGKINIIIAPNKAVIIDKEKAYNNNQLNTKNKIGFFYKESDHKISNDFNLFMFVADSFFLYSSKLWKIKDKFNYILVDEAHSIEIQSSFRWMLVDFKHKVNKYLSLNTAIVSVTASPNHYTSVDIQIKNKLTPPQTINITPDRNSTIYRIKKDIKAKENIVVATNSMQVIYLLRDRNRNLEANFVVGASLMRGCVGSMKLLENPNSNLTIISSRGFEGYDIHLDNCKVYFLEDRAKEHETFYISNLYQAINRTRKGAKYIEYSVRRMKDIRTSKVTEFQINKFIDNKNLSPENKQTKEYKDYHNFVIFNQDKEGKFTVKKNDVNIDLFNEKLLYDKGLDDFSKFLNDRNISINYMHEEQIKVPKISIRLDIQIDNLSENKYLIDKYDLFGDEFVLKPLHTDKFEKYENHIQKYLIRKIYDKGFDKTRELEENEVIGLRILTDFKEFESLVKDVSKTFNKRSIEKYGKQKSKPYRDSFKENAIPIVAELIIGFINKRVHVTPNWVANRNYNVFTKVGIDELLIIANKFNIDFLELDINSAFPRIIYAKNGMDLPDDFYGENKEKKIKINVKLNDFFYKKEKNTDKKTQRNNSILSLKNLGIDDNIIEYLIDNFFESEYRGDLFNFLSFHEKNIISNVKKELDEEINTGVIRRHDSVIVIGNKNDLRWLNNFEYLGKKGWFKVKQNTTIEMPF